jgi:fatty acid desaturase
MEYTDFQSWKIDTNHFPPILAQLNRETEGDYARFRRALKPRYHIVWRDMMLGYAALLASLWAVQIPQNPLLSLFAVAVGAVVIGFFVAYLQLFIHEAAHYNLAADRQKSDRIANTLIAWQVGTSIEAYRRVHFEHHRHLGHAEDGERSYTYALRWRFLFEMLTGIHAIRVFLERRNAPQKATQSKSPMPLVRGATVHAVLIMVLLALGAWSSALAWVGGMAIFFPLFATLRPMLEHRPTDGDGSVLPGESEAVTRMFDDGVFARFFGGAGFNRHLLHHWEPQLSYTRLPELDRYIANLKVGATLNEKRTTYYQAFRAMLSHDNGR